MIDLVVTFPWPETGVSAIVGFGIGFIAGGLAGRNRRSRT